MAYTTCSLALCLPVPAPRNSHSNPKPHAKLFPPKSPPPISATTAETSTVSVQGNEFLWGLENRKNNLLRSIRDTQRGLATTADQRSSIEEALVGVEGFDAGAGIELPKLDGTWRLQYTSAPDVLVLLDSSARIPFFQVGQIFQKFECGNQSNEGVVRNVVRWSLSPLLEFCNAFTNPSEASGVIYLSRPHHIRAEEGATLLVSAKFSVVSPRNIYLQFEEITIQNINISEDLQALIAPAVLPRSFLSLQILQFLRTFKAQIPLRSSESGRRQVGGLYYLSYLDQNMLLGRSVGGGGVFVFTRAQPLV